MSKSFVIVVDHGSCAFTQRKWERCCFTL